MTPYGFSLDGKIALVTGGGRGLGLEIVKAYKNELPLVVGENQKKLLVLSFSLLQKQLLTT
ncbi:MAG: hypothetical protein SAL70_13060 [Scytonema sp. PMC 1070.18]|nr:hypothetical protein [Scytonema sp. PMC 1070.18]